MSDTPKLTVAVEHAGCSYLAREDSVCTKCGKYIKPYTMLERENAALRAELEGVRKDRDMLLFFVHDYCMVDAVGDVDLHVDALANACAHGREDPNDEDYIAAIHAAIAQGKGEK